MLYWQYNTNSQSLHKFTAWYAYLNWCQRKTYITRLADLTLSIKKCIKKWTWEH